MMSCVDKVRDNAERRGLIEPGSRVLAAVSGGPDSMALLMILHELSRETGFDLAAAHFEHGIRPDASRDRALVERAARKLGLPLFVGSGDVPAEARRTKKGIEETARFMRMRFLEDTARFWGANAVALGHTENDQVETILHHIIRGTGWRGLQGIPARRGIFIRPLLSCGRREIVAFLRSRGAKYAVDESNRDVRLLRNRIRHDLLPYLRKSFNPAVDSAILRLAENLAEGWESLERPLRRLVPARRRGGEVHIPLAKLAALADFEIYVLLDLVLRERFGVFQDVEKSHFDAAKRLVRSGRSGRRISFPHGVIARVEHGKLVLARRTTDPAPSSVTTIARTGSCLLPAWNMAVSVERVPADGVDPRARRSEASFAALRFPLRVRARRPGDRIVPFGMKGRKKLSDLFIDRKIPVSRRGRLPVFEDEKGVFWVPGVATDERTRITARTRRVVRITISFPAAKK